MIESSRVIFIKLSYFLLCFFWPAISLSSVDNVAYSYETIWSESGNNKNNSDVYALHVDNNNSIYLSGRAERPFFLKLSDQGEVEVSFTTDLAYSRIAMDSEDNVYLSGHFSNQRRWYSIKDDLDIKLSKFQPNGRKIWEKDFGTDASDLLADVYIDKNNNVYVVATSQDQYLSLHKYNSRGRVLARGQIEIGGAYRGQIVLKGHIRSYLYVNDQNELLYKDIDEVLEEGIWVERLDNSRWKSTNLDIPLRALGENGACAFSSYRGYQGDDLNAFSSLICFNSDFSVKKSKIEGYGFYSEITEKRLSYPGAASFFVANNLNFIVRPEAGGGLLIQPYDQRLIRLQHFTLKLNRKIKRIYRTKGFEVSPGQFVIAFSGENKDGNYFLEVGHLNITK